MVLRKMENGSFRGYPLVDVASTAPLQTEVIAPGPPEDVGACVLASRVAKDCLSLIVQSLHVRIGALQARTVIHFAISACFVKKKSAVDYADAGLGDASAAVQ